MAAESEPRRRAFYRLKGTVYQVTGLSPIVVTLTDPDSGQVFDIHRDRFEAALVSGGIKRVWPDWQTDAPEATA